LKLISCTKCGARRIGPKNDKHPKGAPVVMAFFSSPGAIVMKCHRCTHAMKLTAVEFHRLPVLTAGELEDLGFSSQLAVQ